MGWFEKLTAPAKAVKILENLKAKDLETGKAFSKKRIVYNGRRGGIKMTVALFMRTGKNIDDPELVVSINTTEKWARLAVAKLAGHACGLYYKGEQIVRLSSGVSGGYKHYAF